MSHFQLTKKNNVAITPKQKTFLTYIHDYSMEKGYAPSQQEIANHFGWRSLGTVQDYLRILCQKGLLERKANFPRALEINTALVKWNTHDKEIQQLPITGKIAAGKPIEAIEDIDSPTLAMPNSMLPSGDFFALEVEGKSMIEEGICPGDYIIVKSQNHADEGDMVVALLENEATVKRLYKHGHMLELRPANSEMKSFWVEATSCLIQGVIVGLYRRYQ